MRASLKMALFLLLAAAPLRAVELAGSNAVTGTVQLAGLSVGRQYISVAAAKGYTRILVDLFPYQAERKKLGAAFSYKAVAEDLVKGPALASQPKLKAFKVDIVEYSQRDDYALPVFSSLKALWHGEGARSAKGEISFKKMVEK